MKGGRLVALAIVVAGVGGLARVGAAAPPVQFPAPALTLSVAPVPLGVTRPLLALPAPPPVEAPPMPAEGVPLPRFVTTVAKPLPDARDPGAFACAFVAFRRAATLVDCGVHRLLQGDVQGARDAFEESLAIDPQGTQAPAAHVWLGEVAFLEARYDEAERRYRTALQLGPPRELALHAELGVGWLALRRGDGVEARRALQQALAAVPPQPVALVVRFLDGVARLVDGQAGDALAVWDTVAGSGAPAPMAEELLFWRGVALARIGNADQAVQLLDRFAAAVPATHPLRAEAMVQAGWIALGRAIPDEAERRFLLADQAGPRPEVRPRLRAGLVRAYLALGDTPRALQAAARLAAESPRDAIVAPTLLLVADRDLREGAVTAAIDVYQRILRLPLPPPVSDYVTYRLGESLEHQGRLLEAEDRYRLLRDRGRVEAIAQRAVYRLGLLALQHQDPVRARGEAEGLLRAGVLPELREAVILLAGEAAARGSDPNRAATLFRLALKEFPQSSRAAQVELALGWALLGDGDVQMALRAWGDVARAGDLETGALASLAIADVMLRDGREAEALEALRRLGALPPADPRSPVVGLDHGVLAVRTHADEEALQVLEPLVPRLTDVAGQALARRALGIARYRLGQYDAAEREFRQAASLAPADPSSWLGVGLAALAQNRLAAAEDALGRARLSPVADVGASAAYGLVLAAVRGGDAAAFRERASSFVDRYAQSPMVPVVLDGLAAAALNQGDLDAGDRWVRRLVQGYPKSESASDALLRLATAATGRPALARQAYEQLLARLPTGEGRTEAWLGLAEAALALRDGAAAQRAVQGFLRDAPPSDPRAPHAYALLVRAAQVLGRRDQAIRATETFLARFPGDALTPSVELSRGQLLAEDRQWAAAQQAFEAARDTGEPTVAAAAHVGLGEALRARNDPEGAVAAYLGATYLYPDTPWAVRGLQGAAQTYVDRKMPRDAAIVLRKLLAAPGVDPAVAQWARQALAQLGPVTPEPPSDAFGKGALPKP